MPETEIGALIHGYYPEVQAVYLFGSNAASAARPESDIDLALLLSFAPEPEAPPLALSPCRLALETLTRKTVDLSDLRQADTVFRNEIAASGKMIDCASPDAALDFEALT